MTNRDLSNIQGAKIWVVDDERGLVDAIELLVLDAGFAFQGFTNPVTALAALADDTPDIFIIDLNMPQMSGVELIQKLRALPNTADTPVLVLTAMTSEGMIASVSGR